MNFWALYTYSLIVWISCTTLPKLISYGKPEYFQVRRTFYRIANDKAIPYFSFAHNVWYQDSVGITEVKSIQSIQSSTKDTMFSFSEGYRFIDMRKKWAYDYRNLNDTAEIIRKFSQLDSILVLGGWNFYRKTPIKIDSLRTIGDTSIGGITYLRHILVQYFEGKKKLTEILSRCDKKGTSFQFDEGLNKAIGCPMVKSTSLTPDGKFPIITIEVEFISNKIPDSVKRVFTAWKRNVLKYPVK